MNIPNSSGRINPKTPINSIDRAKRQKLYHQLLEILKEHIENGEWAVGVQIPTEDQLSGKYNVSKATVRLAVSELAALGYLKRFQGKGTFVRRKKPGYSIPMLVNLGENTSYLHSFCITRVFENEIIQPSENIRNHLNLGDDGRCFRFTKLLITKDSPLMLHRLHIVYGLMPDGDYAEEIKNNSFYVFLEEKCGIKVQRVKEITDVIAPGTEEAKLLQATDTPVLRTSHICYVHGDIPVSFSESFYRTDLYARTLEFERLRV